MPHSYTQLPNVYIHPNALVETTLVGPGTRVWAFAHLAPGARIGRDCNICDHTFVEGGVEIGNRVTVKSGVFLWNGVVCEDDVFLGPAAVFTNDLRPRSRHPPNSWSSTLLRVGASVGANATILGGVVVGRFALIGAGAVVTHDIPDYVLAYGNPARPCGFVCRCGARLEVHNEIATCREDGLSYRITGHTCRPIVDDETK